MFGDQSGDVACNSYELWEKDLECIQQLGLTHYRLSLSWARLLPDGTTRHVNQKGSLETHLLELNPSLFDGFGLLYLISH